MRHLVEGDSPYASVGQGASNALAVAKDDSDDATANVEYDIPLAELRALSWVPVSGAASALVTPLGALAVPSPRAGAWTLPDNADPIRRPEIGVVIAWVLVANGVQQFAYAVQYILKAPHHPCSASACVVIIVINTLFVAILLAFLSQLARADFHSLRVLRRAPLPFAVFHRCRANAAAWAACAVGMAAMVWLIVQDFDTFQYAKAIEGEAGGWIAAVENITALVIEGLIFITFLYEFLVFTSLTVSRIRFGIRFGNEGGALGAVSHVNSSAPGAAEEGMGSRA